MDDRRRRSDANPEIWLDSLSQCEQARDRLVQNFLEAIATAGTLRCQLVESPDSVGEQLAQLTQTLRSEAEIHLEAAREMQALMQG